MIKLTKQEAEMIWGYVKKEYSEKTNLECHAAYKKFPPERMKIKRQNYEN